MEYTLMHKRTHAEQLKPVSSFDSVDFDRLAGSGQEDKLDQDVEPISCGTIQ